MKPYTRSIIELFDGKKRFLIPLYQRQYAWKAHPQLELLWEDIERSVARLMEDRRSLTPHFMGAIVIAQVKTFGKELQAFEIIDGQQRLTTFQLLLAALRDVAGAHGSHYDAELQKYLLNDGIMNDPVKERYKLWPSLTDRLSFVKIIDPNVDTHSFGPAPDDESEVVRRSVAAHEYFKEKITAHVVTEEGFDERRFEILFESLKEGLAIVSIELEGGDDPQTIFETLNSRGVDLTPGDLMRNFIFQRAKGMGQIDHSLVVDTLYEKHWLPLDRSFWAQSASRGRQSRNRLDWMLTDHLSMHIGDLVSVESLFERYRRWLLNTRPFPSVTAELESISATAAIERRLFDQSPTDPIGNFGRFADAFDVSTAMPLVIYLATDPSASADIDRALAVLVSYILRRDICGLTTKNYNRLFIGIIDRLRQSEGNKLDALIEYLSSRHSDTDRWPDDVEWQRGWLGRGQYKGPRQARLRYIFEAIELAKRSSLNEDITIRSALTIEHIMPQTWLANWPIPGFNTDEDYLDNDPDYITKRIERDSAIDRMGNLTLLTHSLNASVSNGPYSVKIPAVRAHSSLALNRDLNSYSEWNEEAIQERGMDLFNTARKIWEAPVRPELPGQSFLEEDIAFPPSGTKCKFTYGGKEYQGVIEDGRLVVQGFEPFGTFSAASRLITGTSRNGWNDWHLWESTRGWTVANDWRFQKTLSKLKPLRPDN
ncbi:DUF262 domain-containing protein [Rhizobium ruizarguesonis]|uniref:DUF262 domain-containing protein n=1 Tax=Rhizobium ruizarguesonis TaxID=2081791 RepID=UPI00102F4BD6|nr:DUF262 domain-containing protein [Rhizobium ruizarguesonis]TAT79521.1 DUF262 domain-containing protein [Rhizobium ruizarguesonis]